MAEGGWLESGVAGEGCGWTRLGHAVPEKCGVRRVCWRDPAI